MKKIILLLTVFFTCLSVNAQEATTDYIYSSDGFEVKTGVTYYGQQIHKSIGLYSKDGKVFVAAITSSGSDFYIIDGCETICSGAFQSYSRSTVYFPSTVKNIAPDAITSKVIIGGNVTHTIYNKFGGIKDGVREQNSSDAAYAPLADPNATEVARYNIQGIRINEPAEGINIVHMSDGTSEKVLVK